MKFCKKMIGKQDIVYTVSQVGQVMQAIVKINCIDGIEFAGEPATNEKDAERNVARQAMLSYAGEVQKLASQPSAKKWTKKKSAGSAAASQAGAQAWNDHPKTKLMEVLARILGRNPVKDDCLLQHIQTPVGFQATIQLPGLPGKMGTMAWAGQVVQFWKDAEKSAAKIALDAISKNPEFAHALTKKITDQEGGAAKKQKTSEEKATGVYKGSKERERLTANIVTGSIVEWKGHFGWVNLHTPIEHEEAKKKGGKVYLHQQDWKGAKDPEAGQDIYMYVYTDGNGLGAEEARSLA